MRGKNGWFNDGFPLFAEKYIEFPNHFCKVPFDTRIKVFEKTGIYFENRLIKKYAIICFKVQFAVRSIRYADNIYILI